LGLDLIGLIPVVGEPADAVNAGIYAYRGDYVNAGLSGAAMIPLIGQAATGGKLAGKIMRQMARRGWTQDLINEAITTGQQIPAINRATGNPATRYIHPGTGQSVVVDNVTGEVIHVGGPGFRYGPESGDVGPNS
jgi:hypothetical protein